MAILGPDRYPRGVSRVRTIAATALAAVALMPLASMRPAYAASPVAGFDEAARVEGQNPGPLPMPMPMTTPTQHDACTRNRPPTASAWRYRTIFRRDRRRGPARARRQPARRACRGR